MHPSVTGADARLHHRRLLALLLAGPFLPASAAMLLLPVHLGATLTVIALAAILASGWLAAIVVAATGKAVPAAAFALAAAVAATAAIIAAAGGAGTPVALGAAALLLEPFWLAGTRRSLLIGAGAAMTALVAPAWLNEALFVEAAGAPVWQWLVPMGYAATLLARLPQPLFASRQAGAEPTPIEDMLEAVVIRFGANNDVTFVSDKAVTVLGLRPELLLGQGLFERIHVADRVGYLCAIADLRSGAGNQKINLRLRLPHQTAPENFRAFVMDLACLGSQRSDVAVAVLRCDEEASALRRELDRASEKLESLDLTKDRFLAAVSHELRTPLNAIIGFSDVLLHELYGTFHDSRQKEYVGLIREAGHHLLGVVNTILDVSKIESGSYITHPERFDFREAVHMCRSMLAVQASAKGLALVDEVAATTGQIVADKRAVQQMLINLVANAIKFTPEGGHVAIGAKRIGSRLHFWVADTGIGISEADLERVGRPFVQVQNDYTRRYDGTGLGLALVKGMVMLHDGEMSIESAPGEGTTVFVNLPVEGPAASQTGELLPLEMPTRRDEAYATLRKTA